MRGVAPAGGFSRAPAPPVAGPWVVGSPPHSSGGGPQRTGWPSQGPRQRLRTPLRDACARPDGWLRRGEDWGVVRRWVRRGHSSTGLREGAEIGLGVGARLPKKKMQSDGYGPDPRAQRSLGHFLPA